MKILPSSHIFAIVVLWPEIVSLDWFDLCKPIGVPNAEDPLAKFSFIYDLLSYVKHWNINPWNMNLISSDVMRQHTSKWSSLSGTTFCMLNSSVSIAFLRLSSTKSVCRKAWSSQFNISWIISHRKEIEKLRERRCHQ